MRNDQEKRLIRMLVAACLIILGLLSIIVAMIVVDLSGVKKNQVELTNLVNDLKLSDGVDGYTPIKNVDYFDGKTPQCYYELLQCRGKDSVSTNTTVIKETPVTGKQGESAYDIAVRNGFKGTELEWLESLKGDIGTGIPGKTVFTRQNPLTGSYECRYAGNTEWQPESECI